MSMRDLHPVKSSQGKSGGNILSARTRSLNIFKNNGKMPAGMI